MCMKQKPKEAKIAAESRDGQKPLHEGPVKILGMLRNCHSSSQELLRGLSYLSTESLRGIGAYRAVREYMDKVKMGADYDKDCGYRLAEVLVRSSGDEGQAVEELLNFVAAKPLVGCEVGVYMAYLKFDKEGQNAILCALLETGLDTENPNVLATALKSLNKICVGDRSSRSAIAAAQYMVLGKLGHENEEVRSAAGRLLSVLS